MKMRIIKNGLYVGLVIISVLQMNGMEELESKKEPTALSTSATQDLIKALNNGRAQDALAAIENGADVNVSMTIDPKGTRTQKPIHQVISFVWFANTSAGKFLGAEGQLTDRINREALSLVKSLVEHGAGVNDKDSDKQTPLLLALTAGHDPIIQYLMEQDVSASIQHLSTDNENELKNLALKVTELALVKDKETTGEVKQSDKSKQNWTNVLNKTLLISVRREDGDMAEFIVRTSFNLALDINIAQTLVIVDYVLKNKPIKDRTQVKKMQNILRQARDMKEAGITAETAPQLVASAPEIVQQTRSPEVIAWFMQLQNEKFPFKD